MGLIKQNDVCCLINKYFYNFNKIKIMKKLLLFIAVSISVYGNAQSCTGTIFTSGPNPLGTGGAVDTYKQNCLTYNADLNTVLWTQRASPYWNFAGYTSGSIQSTWLNVATNTWDSMIIYTDVANTKGARYPGGTIFNPAGNTNIANALMVGSGPANNGVNWVGTWYSNRQPTGAYHTVSSTQDDNSFCVSGAAPFGSTSGNPNYSGDPNADMQQVGNTVLVAGNIFDENFINQTNIIPFKGAVIGKGVYAGGNLTWSADSIIPNFRLGSLGYLNSGSSRIAFSPDGQIGYLVFIGRLATNFGNNADSTLSPIVYKTTNGGASWSATPLLPGFDWSVGHPEMLKNVANLYPNTRTGNQFMPYIPHGIDLTVDSTGVLHLVSVVTTPLPNVASSLDSIADYSLSYHWNYTTHHPIIWDMMTDGTTWNTLMVDSIKTGLSDVNAADSSTSYSLWSLGYGARIQVSRSTTGGKIFYSWADSDSSLTHTLYNTNPDIYMKSYDITHQLVTPTSNETPSNGQCYFHYLSDVSYYDSNVGGWVCPLVYTTDIHTTPPFLSTDTVNYHYLNCATFYVYQYNTAASVYRTQGAAGITSYTNNDLIKVYPNPSNGNVYVEFLNQNETIVNLQITDVVGKEIRQENLSASQGKINIDMSNLNSGVYFITAKTASGISTQKIILQR